MTAESVRLAAVRESTAALIAHVEGLRWSDADIAAPSLCSGWTRGHVLTHIARNADGIADTVLGAVRGEIVLRYPGGATARNAAIDAGAGRSFTELAEDVRASAQRLDDAFTAIGSAAGWDRPTAEDRDARWWLAARRKEVEIHRVDLDAGYPPQQWPADFVADMLVRELERLPERTDEPVEVTVTNERFRPGVTATRPSGSDREPTRVSGPDWAVLAWLVGRPAAAGNALTGAAELSAFN